MTASRNAPNRRARLRLLRRMVHPCVNHGRQCSGSSQVLCSSRVVESRAGAGVQLSVEFLDAGRWADSHAMQRCGCTDSSSSSRTPGQQRAALDAHDVHCATTTTRARMYRRRAWRGAAAAGALATVTRSAEHSDARGGEGQRLRDPRRDRERAMRGVERTHLDRRRALPDHVDPGRGGIRKIDQPVVVERPAIVDAHDDALAVVEIRYARVGRQRQRLVRGGEWRTCRRARARTSCSRGTCCRTTRRCRARRSRAHPAADV